MSETLTFDRAKAVKFDRTATVSAFTILQTEKGGIGNANAAGMTATGLSCVPGLSCAVDNTLIPLNSFVEYDGSVWLAGDVCTPAGPSTPTVSFCFYSQGVAKQFGTRKEQTIYVLKPDASGYQELYDLYTKHNDLDSLTDEEGQWVGGSLLWCNFDITKEYSGIQDQLKRSKERWEKSTQQTRPYNPVVKDSSIAESSEKSFSNSVIYRLATLQDMAGSSSFNTITGDSGVSGVGAGVPGRYIDDNNILDFTSFIQTRAFLDMMQGVYNTNGQWSFHDYITNTMTKFYHQLYYIPNLTNNKVIVVKPETLFIEAPSCNVIYPNMKTSITYSRPFKQEPTRLIQVTDPISGLNAGSAGSITSPSSLFTIAYLDEQKLGIDSNGMPIYKIDVRGLDSVSNREYTDSHAGVRPILRMTDYERRQGIRTSTVHKGADMYLFMISDYNYKTQRNKATHKTEAIKQITVNTDAEGTGKLAHTLAALAKYELCRAKYTMRQGSADLYFNPYIVPGFPMVSVETTESSMNVYGYVTNVVHNLSERSWTTTISFNCAHSEHETVPGAFPITEQAYATNIADTYKDMLGPSVLPIHGNSVKKLIDSYTNEKDYITQSYRKVWRKTPTLKDYCEFIADGATVVEDQGFMWLKNKEDDPDKKTQSGFFDSNLQNIIKEYTARVLQGEAFSVDDVN